MDSGTPTPCRLGSHGHLFRTSLGAQCLPLSPTILQYPELKCCLYLYIAAKELHSAYKDEVLVRQCGSLRPPSRDSRERTTSWLYCPVSAASRPTLPSVSTPPSQTTHCCLDLQDMLTILLVWFQILHL